MSRPIKFRAWYRPTGEMVDVSVIDWSEVPDAFTVHFHQAVNYDYQDGGVWSAADADVELMQYTGLTDKNGEEIYEGDIVTGWLPGSLRDVDFECMVVRFDEGSFDLYRPDNATAKSNPSFGDLSSCTLNKSIRIIGNIYENPELLEDK